MVNEQKRHTSGTVVKVARRANIAREDIFSLGRKVAAVLRYVVPTTKWGDHILTLIAYIFKLRRIPRVRSPKLFNDHLLKLKLDGKLSDPLRQVITDKEYVKYYVAGAVGDQYTLRTFAILRTEVEIDRFVVKDIPCVLKPTHLSGSPILFHLDREDTLDRQELRRWLRLEYYRRSREANYRYLEHKIIVEEFFSEDGRTPPRDYKLFCFDGYPKFIQVDSNRFLNHTRNLYDTGWNRLPIMIEYPPGLDDDPRPQKLDTMIDIARKLSQPFSFLRVDLYANEAEVKVGELTNFHGNGNELIRPAEAESWLGELFEGKPLRIVRSRP